MPDTDFHEKYANPRRGEANFAIGSQNFILRPSFAALVAAEEELGSLFELVERAASGKLKLSEIAILFWHVIADRPAGLLRDAVGAQIMQIGLAGVTPLLKNILKQILQGQPPAAGTE